MAPLHPVPFGQLQKVQLKVLMTPRAQKVVELQSSQFRPANPASQLQPLQVAFGFPRLEQSEARV